MVEFESIANKSVQDRTLVAEFTVEFEIIT